MKHRDRALAVDLYVSCWNNADILGFFFRHYDPIVRTYVVFDDGSTDGSAAMLAAHPRVEVQELPTALPSESRAMVTLSPAESCWRKTSADADWVIICDVDEHLYHRNLGGYLAACKAQEITILPALGYQMLSDRLPAGGLLADQVTRGAPFEKMSKLNIFNPQAIERLNYGVGRHRAAPIGRVIAPDEDELLNLHFKYLDFERVMTRHAASAMRLNKTDRENGWGHRWQYSREELQADWAAFETRAIDVIRDPYPAETHGEPRWWDRYRRRNQSALPTASTGKGLAGNG